GISGPATCLDYFDWLACNSLGRIDDFANGESRSGANVVNELVTGVQCFESEYVCVSQITYMDVIANACSVRRGVVSSINGNVVAHARCRLQNDRNQVRFRIV